MNTYISKKIINFARSFPDLGIQSKPRPEEWKTPDSTCRTKSSSMTNNNRILFISQEILAMQIASVHNLAFYLQLVKEARRHIVEGDFKTWKTMMVERVTCKSSGLW